MTNTTAVSAASATVRVITTFENQPTPSLTTTVPVSVTATAVRMSATPTLDSLRHIPVSGVITGTYTVRLGDTLSGIAASTGATVEELQQINGLANANSLKEGQVLQILLPITGHAPSIKLIPDSELVDSPTAAKFDMTKFIAVHSGYLMSYTEEVDNAQMTGPRIVQRVAEQFSVHPRILLALLEYKGGWVDNPSPTGDQLKYPLGYNLTDQQSLYLQLSWAAARLNEGYYGWRLATRLWVRLNDGTRAYMGDGINAGTAGLQNYLAAISTSAVWQGVLGTGGNGFIQTYKRLFGDPWQFDLGMLVPDGLKQPALALPWPKGQTWLYTGGPHAAWGVGSPWGALDFTSWSAYGCDQLSDWVTAMAAGIVTRSNNGEVVESLDLSGDEHVGWSILYMHISSDDRIKVGDTLKVGSQIGHPSCEGGVSNGAHTHLVRRYNGEWLNAVSPIPFNVGGWTPVQDSVEYDGALTNGKLTRQPCECKEMGTNGITN
ncbi:MAG TPA: LysM peptidoglycan-binding domain-containing protein [Anaerolineae bacterium]